MVSGEGGNRQAAGGRLTIFLKKYGWMDNNIVS